MSRSRAFRGAALRSTSGESSAQEAQALPQTPVIDYVVNRGTLEDLFVTIVEAVKEFTCFFRTEREVLAWVGAGRPVCESPAKHSTSQPWAETIDAILRMGAFDSFLTNFERSEHAFDPRYELMAEVAREHHQRGLLQSAEWVPHIETMFEERFRDRRGQVRSARAKATIVGSMFSEYLGTRFELDDRLVEIVRDWPQGTRRSAAYGFKQVSA